MAVCMFEKKNCEEAPHKNDNMQGEMRLKCLRPRSDKRKNRRQIGIRAKAKGLKTGLRVLGEKR